MFTREMMKALEADGEKLRQETGQEHGPLFGDYSKIEERVVAHFCGARGAGDPVIFYSALVIANGELFAERGITKEGWYFYDETWADARGPYASEVQVREQLALYIRTSLGEKP